MFKDANLYVQIVINNNHEFSTSGIDKLVFEGVAN